MARASTPTKLPLDTFARIFGMHPLHFNQVVIPDIGAPCDVIMFQHTWQTADAVSREEIAIAIAEAESRMEQYLHFRLAPTWEKDEWRGLGRPFQSEYVNYSRRDVRGFHQSVTGDWGYLIAGGTEAKTLIEADATIVFTDKDGDGYFETATVTVPTSVTDVNEIAIYYPGKDADDTWEIRPTQVSILAGVATITFRREMVVLEDLLEAMDTQDSQVDGLDDAQFLETVDVYRHWNDPSLQAQLLWEPIALGCGFCGASGCDNCAYAFTYGCLLGRGDPRQSIMSFQPATWNADTFSFDWGEWAIRRQADIVRLNYYGGFQNKRLKYDKRMDPQWERAVAYMAMCLLERPPCTCALGSWNRWRSDLLLARGSEDGIAIFQPLSSRSTLSNPLDNPFGTRRGELYAWSKCVNFAIGSAVLI